MDQQAHTDAAADQVVDIDLAAKSLTPNQQAVLIEAMTFSYDQNRRSGSKEQCWYHRGKFGFGISRRTAASLVEKGLAHQSIWEQWHRDTQFVQLTRAGHAVALKLSGKTEQTHPYF